MIHVKMDGKLMVVLVYYCVDTVRNLMQEEKADEMDESAVYRPDDL